MIEFYGWAQLKSSLSVLRRRDDECDRRRAGRARFVCAMRQYSVFMARHTGGFYESLSVGRTRLDVSDPTVSTTGTLAVLLLLHERSRRTLVDSEPLVPNFCLTVVAVALFLFDWQTKRHEKTTTTTKKKLEVWPDSLIWQSHFRVNILPLFILAGTTSYWQAKKW